MRTRKPFMCGVVVAAAASVFATSSAPASAATTVTIGPCTAVDCVRNALAQIPPGGTLVLQPGFYGDQQYIGNLNTSTLTPGVQVNLFTVYVTLQAQPGAWANSWTFSRDSGIVLNNLDARPTSPTRTGIRIVDGTHNIYMTGARVDASGGGAHGIVIQSTTGFDRVNTIVVDRNDVWGSAGDLVGVYGADNSWVMRNRIHDPHIDATTTDHVDGIQYTGGTGGGAFNNLIYRSGPTAATGFGGPHQGIVASVTAGGAISGYRIYGNRVFDWPGTGIIVSTNHDAGTIDNVALWGNEVDCAGGPVTVSGGTHMTVYANTFANYGPTAPAGTCPAEARLHPFG